MTIYAEKTLTSLLEGALDVDGDPISVRRINGTVPSSWPYSVGLPGGAALVEQDGTILYDDLGDASNHPDRAQANGAFTYTLWDGQDESIAYTASIVLENQTATITAPAQPLGVTVANETSSSFEVTLPVDPDDGGSSIFRRVLAILPEDEYLLGDFSNAVYFNDLNAQETRTITASIYSPISSSTSHVVRWKAVNTSTDNSGHGPYSDPVVATLPAASSAPVFTTQPSFNGSSFTAGNTITLDLGTGTGDNAVTASIEYFRLGSVSKTSELSGLNWNSSGEGAGTLFFRTRLTDTVTGSFTLSNQVTATLTASGGTGSIKDQVIALFGTSGRNSVNSIQNLNAGTAPAGVSVNAGANIATISGTGVVLQDYIINDLTVFLNSNNVTVRQCRITEGTYQHANPSKRLFDIKSNVKNFLFEDNDFAGVKGFGNGVGSGIFQRPLTSSASGTGGIIRRNRFKYFGQDVIKTTGGVLVEENVIYSPSNIDTTPSGRWNASTSYSLDEIVKHTSNEKHYVSRVNNNQGNSLNDSSKWRYYDPHYDLINPFENTLPSTFRRNLILRNPQDPLIPASERSYAVGSVNALRLIRNQSTNNTTFYAALLLEENVLQGRNPYFSGPPIQAASTGGNWVKPTITGNYIDADASGSYAHPSTASSVSWGVNYDTTTGAVIFP